MSGKIIIKNADGSDVTQANGTALSQPQELSLYSVPSLDTFDTMCGTTNASAYADGGQKECAGKFLPGTHDTDFEKCMQAIDCMMNKEMRVVGFDSHQSHIVTFMQQMIPHHANAVNMAKILLKHAETQVAAVEDLEDIMWGMINVQNFQIHVMRNYLANHAAYGDTIHDGVPLLATSVGEHCESTLDVDVVIPTQSQNLSPTTSVSGCTPSETMLCMKVGAVSLLIMGHWFILVLHCRILPGAFDLKQGSQDTTPKRYIPFVEARR
ncbi:unnamed protein product [Symbiodinium pilosum]|uniref:DUF305 domain-containing protein n=1 Tax=Symbiodinium pilosum TaxID=2952 RepID=A0A812V912_SYMPI|nr:unnamed protein product [Symbiodinium pilosum]